MKKNILLIAIVLLSWKANAQFDSKGNLSIFSDLTNQPFVTLGINKTDRWSIGMYEANNPSYARSLFIYEDHTGVSGSKGVRFLIKPNGNVGIGTTSPSEKLSLEGDSSTKLKIQNNSSTKDLGIWLRGKRSGSNIYSSHYIGTEGESHYNLKINADELLKFQTNSQDRLTILGNGKVGIGTTSPSVKLDVNGNIKASSYSIISTDYNSRLTSNMLQFSRDGFSYIDNKKSNGSIAIRTGGTGNVDLLVRSDGNVGIGTTSPSAKLEISHHENIRTVEINPQNQLDITGNSSLTIKEFVPSIEFSDSSNSSSAAVVFANNSSFFIGKKSGVKMTSSELFNVNLNSGKVGIGTLTTGNHKLAVEGSIGAREIKVEAAPNWSDFVFYDNYNLPTLQEVENHIKEKGHLKDIPSAKEVEKNGFFLGEMDSKLLQKIEELTLYTIDQQKEINSQKKEIEELKTLVQKLLKDKN
ncbi:hypothetical protein [Tenacibaculum sp. C7A-26P2]|uniref:hypothetical protein n=1 Tax=Tenacibaculum sp. C7A-26P2 TaxID=3447504 RepID=UPI003F87183F